MSPRPSRNDWGAGWRVLTAGSLNIPNASRHAHGRRIKVLFGGEYGPLFVFLSFVGSVAAAASPGAMRGTQNDRFSRLRDSTHHAGLPRGFENTETIFEPRTTKRRGFLLVPTAGSGSNAESRALVARAPLKKLARQCG